VNARREENGMGFRQLSIPQAAARLHVPAAEVERLVKYREIPFVLRGDEPVFVRRDLDAWASQRLLESNGGHAVAVHRASTRNRQAAVATGHERLVPRLFRAAWIAPALQSRTKPSVLRDMVTLAATTNLLYDDAALLHGLEEREALCSTAIDQGVAFLHSRYHDPHLCGDSFVVLGRLARPIFAGAADGRATDLFFLVCCSDDALHLHVLARLCALAHSTPVLTELRQAATAAEMLAVLVRSEDALLAAL
jgi:PTS system nitrogen regulatory IIA component